MEQVQPSIEEMNEIIGIFMGQMGLKKIAGRNQKRFYYNDIPFAFVKDTTSLNYHKCWNELMPVWNKLWYDCAIVPMKYEREWSEIRGNKCARAILYGNITDAHKEIYNAIQWYNGQQKQSI